MEEDDQKATPLLELLRSVPRNAVWVFDDVMSSSVYAVGRLCHEAADEIDGLRVSTTMRGVDVATLQEENERLLAANRNCMDWYQSAMDEVDRLRSLIHLHVNASNNDDSAGDTFAALVAEVNASNARLSRHAADEDGKND